MNTENIKPSYPSYHLQPLRLSNEEMVQPGKVLKMFFDQYSLPEIRFKLKKWLRYALSVDDVDPLDCVDLYENIEVLIEASSIICEMPKNEREDAMETFIGILGHELEMHIDGIQTAINYYEQKKEESPDDIDYYHSLLKASAGDASDILRNMITSAKYSSGKLNLSISSNTFFIDQWIRKIFAPFKMRANVQDRKLTVVNIDNILGLQIKTDKVKFGQIITNLLSNAFKYAQPGSPISVDFFPNDLNITFRVTNKGVIPDCHIPNLFKPYVTVDAGHAGTGLGLYVSKLYADLLGAMIHVNCTESGHTVFEVDLPNCIQVIAQNG